MEDKVFFDTQATNMTLRDWQRWVAVHKYPSYVALQVCRWFYLKNINDPNLFSDLRWEIREHLAKEFDWKLPLIDSLLASNEDSSEKILLKHPDGALSECVLMIEKSRVTLCVSCQVGCKMGCSFCQTGKMGFNRNLSAGEILIQLVIANRRLLEKGLTLKVTNVVFMGMGEPLDNYEAVVEACRCLVDPKLFGLSKNRVTVSTCGIVPAITKLAGEVAVSLAISLHGADDVTRSELMPINRRYPLEELKEVLLNYPIRTRHGLTFEYVMIRGVNDSLLHAKRLVSFLHGFKKMKVNLIPMNPYPGSALQSSNQETIYAFQQYLAKRHIPAPIRYSRGKDVSAACGQLATKRADEIHLSPQLVRLGRKKTTLTVKQ